MKKLLRTDMPFAARRLYAYALLALLLLALMTACAPPPMPMTNPTATPVSAPPERVLVLGDISDDPGEVIEGTQPLADYLAAQLADYGIARGTVRVAANADEMTRYLENEQVDLYFDSVYPATLISDASGAQPILRRWRFGVESYYSIIFTSQDSGIASVEELAGQMIALDNAFSTSGFLLPVVYLQEQGLTLVGKESYEDPVAADEVGFVFSYDDENTLQWVLSGRVAAGATDDYNFNVAFPPGAQEQLLSLAETERVPRQVVVARPGLEPDLLEAIKRVLSNANEDPEAEAALEAFQTTRFDEFPEGIETAQEQMREMMQDVAGISLPD